MQRPHRQPTSVVKHAMVSQHSVGSNPRAAGNHWAALKNYVAFQRQGTISAFDEFRNIFTLTLTDIEWNWFELPTLNEKFMEWFYS